MRKQSRLWRTSALLSAALLSGISASAASTIHLDHRGERWARKTLHKMTLEEKIGQMIMVWAKVKFLNVQSPELQQLRQDMVKYHVGGFGVTVEVEDGQLVKSEPLEAAALTNDLQKDSKYPLIFAADFERGLSMRLNGATAFPAAMAFGAAGDPKLASEFGRITAAESRAIGVQWNWFPVADVNSNPANPIIDTRSFGEDPALVSKMVDAYIEGAHREGMLTTVKHFPGHGDTDTDSHLSLARVNGNMERLNTLELVPFRSAIAAGVDTVMVGHLLVPAIEPDPNVPASISPKVITGLLKDQLGFNGLVVTDGLDMAGLTKVFHGSEHDISAQIAVAAVRAGEDMLILPGDLDGAVTGLLDAVKRGEISEQRIDQSVLKILQVKASLDLNRHRTVRLEDVQKVVSKPENVALAQQIADRAITLVADSNHSVPLPVPPQDGQPSGIVAVLFTDHPAGSEGSRAFVSQLRQRATDAQVFYVNRMSARYEADAILAAAAKAEHVIAVAEAVPNPRRTTQGHSGGSASLDTTPLNLLNSLVQQDGAKTVLAAFGNPYTGGSVPGLQSYICTFSNTPESAESLVAALFGEIPIHGRLPVTIPGMAQRGSGLDRDARAAKAGAQ